MRLGPVAAPGAGALPVPGRLWAGWLSWAVGPAWRGRRVAVLAIAVVVMSLADLVLTMTYLLNVGMIESNPVARIVMVGGGPGQLVAWKLATTGLAVGILVRLRRRAAAEFGALACCAVLVWLMVRWIDYVEVAPTLSGVICSMPDHVGEEWVSFVQPLGGT